MKGGGNEERQSTSCTSVTFLATEVWPYSAKVPQRNRTPQPSRLRQLRDHGIRAIAFMQEIEHDDVGFGVGRSDGGTVRQAVHEELRVRVVLDEAAQVAVEGVEGRGGEDPRLAHPAPQPLTDLPGERAVPRREREARANGTPETLRA